MYVRRICWLTKVPPSTETFKMAGSDGSVADGCNEVASSYPESRQRLVSMGNLFEQNASNGVSGAAYAFVEHA